MYCSSCGANIAEANFCMRCGAKVDAAQCQDEIVLWSGKPAGVGDKAKGAFNSTTYTVTNERIIVSTGLIGRSETETELLRLQDVKVTQSLAEKMAGVGDVTIVSSDVLDGTLVFNNVRNPFEVKEIIRAAAANLRKRLHVEYRGMV